METAIIMLRQIAIMAMLIVVGIWLARKGFLSEQGTRDLGAVLLHVVIPAVIVKSFIGGYSQERVRLLGLSFLFTVIAALISILISRLIFGRRLRLENFAASFGNVGFIGIPLVQALIGPEGVFFVVAPITLIGILQWTYGVYVMTGDKNKISARKVLKNPFLLATLLGFVLFFSRLPVPGLVVSTLDYIGGLNTPVAMILMGTYMARLPLRRILLEKRAYFCSLTRLLIIPILTLLLFRLVPVDDTAVRLAVFLTAATPVGANICIFAQQNDCDYEYSVILVCLSTLLSAVTVPLMVSAAQMIL